MILFSTGCGKCEILKKKLIEKGIKFDIISDIEEIKKTGHNSVPLLKIDGNILNFMDSIKYINNL